MNSSEQNIVIAIDGPSASGKSTIARELARALPGFIYVDTGAMYRAVTWRVLREKINPQDSHAVENFVKQMPFHCEIRGNTIALKFENPVDPFVLRKREVNENVSTVSLIPAVRQRLVYEQQQLRAFAPLVMEGRDIGSVVFPDTPYKFYLDAKLEVRAERRKDQGENDSISQRDAIDSSRKISPLKIASDAHVVDSSTMTISEVVAYILQQLSQRGLNVENVNQS